MIQTWLGDSEYLTTDRVGLPGFEVSFDERGDVEEILQQENHTLRGEIESCDIGNGTFSLSVLDLRAGQNSGITRIYNDAFKGLAPTLEVLDLQGNNLKDIPKSAFGLRNLEILDVSDNLLDISLEKHMFEKFKNLEMLSLHNNPKLRGGVWISTLLSNRDRLFDSESVIEIDLRNTKVICFIFSGSISTKLALTREVGLKAESYRIKLCEGLLKVIVHTDFSVAQE